MSDDAAVDRVGSKHAYQQVADAITARIETGRYLGKMPSERELALEFKVSYITVRHATAILRGLGLIETIHGRGTFTAPGVSQKSA